MYQYVQNVYVEETVDLQIMHNFLSFALIKIMIILAYLDEGKLLKCTFTSVINNKLLSVLMVVINSVELIII